MALVFRVWSEAQQDFAVVKVLSPQLDESPMLRQRWANEAKLGQWLDHPSVARILDAGRDAAGRPYLAMEYVSGQTIQALHDELRARGRRFPPHLAVAITRAVLEALERVHQAKSPQDGRRLGIVHRDLKPANVMITYAGQIKVLDFGVARVDLGDLKTQTGTLTGTPGYMSPEQVMADKRLDGRSDIYSWGAVVHELLSGQPLVPDTPERIDQLKAVLTAPPPPVRPNVPELTSDAVDAALACALQKDPNARFSTAAGFWRAFEQAAVPQLGIGTADELGRLVRSLFPGGLEKERLLRAQPRARSAPLTEVVAARPPSDGPAPAPNHPRSMDEPPEDPGPLPPSPLEVPPAVPGYAVKGRLGEGGTGIVFVVEHLTSGAERALKVLRPELAGHPDIRRRFSVEAQLGQRIDHPGVVRVYEIGEDAERRPYMVMDRVVGQDLGHWLRRLERAGRRMPPQAAVRIALEVLDVLEHVHTLDGPQGRIGIVHRDLKPSNVMVGPDGRVRVLDFGIARAFLGQARTRTGYRSGTEMYMSPEQALARKDLDHRSDIYTWAAVIYELLTGLALLHDTNAVEVLPTIVHTPPERLLRPLRSIVPALEPPLAQALAKEPDHRFASASAFATAIVSAAPQLVGLTADALGRMWQTEPPLGLQHGRASTALTDAAASEAVTDGLPVLPGYQVKKKLDEGGCGELWLATKEGDATWWVIKTLQPDLARRPDIRNRFEREVRILAELDHPHIVRVHGARRTPDGQLFTVMEYIRGIDFERILYDFRAKDRRLPIDVSLRVTLDVLAGLHAAHELAEDGRSVGVVHRDLSPRNLMVDASGATKVIDFGLAAAQLSTVAHRTRADVGTPRFWSPEQAAGDSSIDRRSDVYAAGVILYEALTGRGVVPFAELPAIRRAVLQDICPPAHAVVDGLPRPLGDAVAKAMRKDPATRYSSADEFRRALLRAWGDRPLRDHGAVATYLRREGPRAYRQAAEQSPVAAGAPGLVSPTRPGVPHDLTQDGLHPPTRLGQPQRPRARRRWLAAAGAVVIAIVVVAAALEPSDRSSHRKASETSASAASHASVSGVPKQADSPIPPPSSMPTPVSPAQSKVVAPTAVAISASSPIAVSVPEAAAVPPISDPAPQPPPRRTAAALSRPTSPPARRNRAPATSSLAIAPGPTDGSAAGSSRKAAREEEVNDPSATLARIRRESRNRVEAAEMLRRAARAAEQAGRLPGDARAGLETCLARRFMDPRERVIRECGRWLRR